MPFVNKIGSALGEIKKNISSATYRVKKMDEIIPKINQSLSQQHHLGGPVVSSYVDQCMSAISTIELIAQKVEESSDSININLDLIQNTEDLQGFDPDDYEDDITYFRRNIAFKMDRLQSEFLAGKIQLENAQSLISMAKAKMEKSASTSLSRNSSPVRPYIMWSNADSMKPPTLSYSSATVSNVKEHMKRVNDWIPNLYPNGYSFSHYKSNFTSSIDLKFSIKGDSFEGCRMEQDLKDQIEYIVEVKYPIHTRRRDAINPTLRSNEEASSFLKRTLMDFTDAKMAQAHWQNLLIHLILRNLPNSDVFKKQCDFLSRYLSEISINKGGTAKADLKKMAKT